MLVLVPVRLQRAAQKFARVVLSQMKLSVLRRSRRGSASDNDAVSALVEHLRDARRDRSAVLRPVEGDADEAALQGRIVADHAPWCATGLVVQRGEEVPGASGLVLQLGRHARTLLGTPGELGVIRRWTHQLERHAKAHRAGLEEIVESTRQRLRRPAFAVGLIRVGHPVVLEQGERDRADDHARLSGLGHGLDLGEIELDRGFDRSVGLLIRERVEIAGSHGSLEPIAEDEPGAESEIGGEAGERLPEIGLVVVGLGRKTGLAALQPASRAFDAAGVAYEANVDRGGRILVITVSRAVVGDAEPRIDVTLAVSELEKRLIEDGDGHAARRP